MNDYRFDYMNYINNIPSDMMNMDNKFNGMNSIKMDAKFNNNQGLGIMSKNKILEPYEGFIKGNLFENLYDPYKNYKPQQLSAGNEREALLYQIMQYKFALTELNLYLDTNPDDRRVIEIYNNYLSMEKQMCDQYEKMYGPLTVDSNYLNNKSWIWINNPWPWEVM